MGKIHEANKPGLGPVCLVTVGKQIMRRTDRAGSWFRYGLGQ